MTVAARSRIIPVILAALGLPLPAGEEAPEGLEEMRARADRHASARWDHRDLEDPGHHHTWQPETLCYRDVQTGAEVWRLTHTPSRSSWYHSDINFTPWSADGKLIAFTSDRDTGAFDRNRDRVWFVAHSSGAGMRPVIGGPARVYRHTLYFHWSPQIPDVYYEFGRNAAGARGMRATDLYKATVADDGITRARLLSFPSGRARELKLDKTISADGRKVIAMPWDESRLYPATIYPDSRAAVDVPDGYAVDRDLPACWGDTPESCSSFHDQYLLGDGSWHLVMPSGSHAIWRIRARGSAPDGGAVYSFTPPDGFGEAWPENTLDKWGGKRDPFGAVYLSHFVPDRWGRHILHSNGESRTPGPAVWDLARHRPVVATFGGGSQHHAWDGFTDRVASSRGPSGPGYAGDRLYVARYDAPGSQETVAHTHTLFNSNGVYAGHNRQYASLTRPAQSPDGTKIAFHSTFLNSTDESPDIYWAVALYPLPPTHLEAGKGGPVAIAWLPPRYTQRRWPFARAQSKKDPLGWPLLDSKGLELGEVLYAREIKAYHVFRSPGAAGPWTEVGSVKAEYAHDDPEDPDFLMLRPVVGGRAVSETNKLSFADSPGDGELYYAVTAEEHSGIESRELSEVIRVKVSGGKVVDSAVAGPAGQRDFWRTPPPAPSPATAELPAGGEYRLRWTEPRDPMVRYYNIYYSISEVPPPTQERRIASVPAGTAAYLDWLADTSRPGFYRLTSVDRHGNEGVEPGAAPVPAGGPAGGPAGAR